MRQLVDTFIKSQLHLLMIAIIFNELTGNFKTVYLYKWPSFLKNEYEQKTLKWNKQNNYWNTHRTQYLKEEKNNTEIENKNGVD